jgi:5-(aminomethyl)-3-furanmethanol phosphate kinase
MWVVKLGGSLNGDPLLPQWLTLLSELGGGRVTVVCGGGAFADEVRRAQAHWRFDDLAAHNMALLAMVQGAYMLRALCPTLEMVYSEAGVRQALRRAQTALWVPLELLREQPDADTNWEATSDSIALGLAARLNAERLLLVKSCPVDKHQTLAELAAAGVVDARLADAAGAAACRIEVLSRDELPRVHRLLLGPGGPPTGRFASTRP